MWPEVGKYVGGKVLTALLVVASAGGVIWFWKHPEQLQAIWQVIKYVLVWLGFVLVLPWSTFLINRWVVLRESNVAAGIMLACYVALDAGFALMLAGAGGHGMLTWCVLLLGFLCAAVYNYLVCDFQAARMEESV